MLTIKDLSFCYPRQSRPVISDMDLQIAAGGIYGLLGPNGAGKSTLLYLISGLLTPKTGEVDLFSVNTRLRRPETLRDIFLVPEEFTLPSTKLSTYVRNQSKFYPNFSMQDLQEHLDTFEMGGYDYNLASLSMGQKKKIYMSFALATNTPLMLMDEPTNGLDIPGKAAFRRFIASKMDENRTVVISTHQVRDIDQLLDHVIIMDQRTVRLVASMQEVADRLMFKVSNRPQDLADALLTIPDLDGTMIVSPNTAGAETCVNLELLFQLAINRPDVVSQIFKQ